MKCYVSTLPDGRLAITRLAVEGFVLRENYDNDGEFSADVAIRKTRHEHRLAKTMFELSRKGNLTEHFDPAIHTLETIAAGISGHFPLACVEMDDSTFPVSRAQRDNWELFKGIVRVKPSIIT